MNTNERLSGPGPATSDEILERGQPVFNNFFYPTAKTLNKWVEVSGRPQRARSVENELEPEYYRQRGINLSNFEKEAARCEKIRQGLDTYDYSIENDLNKLWGVWRGDAAETAKETCGLFFSSITSTLESLADRATRLRKVAYRVEEALNEKALRVVREYQHVLDVHTPDDLVGIYNFATGQLYRSIYEATYINYFTGANIPQNQYLYPESYMPWRTEATIKAVQTLDACGLDFDRKCDEFLSLCRDYDEKVVEAFKQLNPNPLSQLAQAEPPSPPSQPQVPTPPTPGPPQDKISNPPALPPLNLGEIDNNGKSPLPAGEKGYDGY